MQDCLKIKNPFRSLLNVEFNNLNNFELHFDDIKITFDALRDLNITKVCRARLRES